MSIGSDEVYTAGNLTFFTYLTEASHNYVLARLSMFLMSDFGLKYKDENLSYSTVVCISLNN